MLLTNYIVYQDKDVRQTCYEEICKYAVYFWFVSKTCGNSKYGNAIMLKRVYGHVITAFDPLQIVIYAYQVLLELTGNAVYVVCLNTISIKIIDMFIALRFIWYFTKHTLCL